MHHPVVELIFFTASSPSGVCVLGSSAHWYPVSYCVWGVADRLLSALCFAALSAARLAALSYSWVRFNAPSRVIVFSCSAVIVPSASCSFNTSDTWVKSGAIVILYRGVSAGTFATHGASCGLSSFMSGFLAALRWFSAYARCAFAYSSGVNLSMAVSVWDSYCSASLVFPSVLRALFTPSNLRWLYSEKSIGLAPFSPVILLSSARRTSSSAVPILRFRYGVTFFLNQSPSSGACSSILRIDLSVPADKYLAPAARSIAPIPPPIQSTAIADGSSSKYLFFAVSAFSLMSRANRPGIVIWSPI